MARASFWRGTAWRRAGRLAIAAAAILLGSVFYCWLTLPDVRPLRTAVPKTTAFMDLRLAEARSEGRKLSNSRFVVSYDRISPSLIQAVLVAEDAAFFQHGGVDYDELRVSIQTNLERGEFVRGASTITQQLAKNLYLSPSRNPYRKLRELLITRRLEAELSKRRILELYLNVIEWGDGIWGVEAASRHYFGVSASDLTREQSALLAGAIPNPRVYNPAKPSARLLSRQKIILGRMTRRGSPAGSGPAPGS
jgi:monofunctional biosynthetic peptidoglycan transglycosylase